MNVWMVSPELSPYVSPGGIGSGVRGLAEVLLRRGHQVTVVLPVAGESSESAGVLSRLVKEPSGLRVRLFDVPGFDPENGGYGSDVSEDPAAARRPGLFAKAVVEVILREHMSERIDIVHAHEWPAAMVPYLLRERGAAPATVLTIHSLAHQGLFPAEALGWFGLGPEHATIDRLELYGRISLMKGGLVAADQITTVSPSYAVEIQSPERGERLDGVIRARRDALTGIINGINVTLWNPATDPALPARFDARDTAGKEACKRALCAALTLHDIGRPLVASLGRLVEQKGIDLLLDALPAIVEAGANVVIAGAGDPTFARAVRDVAAGFPGRVVAAGHIADEDARRLLAAADLLVMPSRWEPCGLVQLQAMRYGAIPVARRTGGLADTVVDEVENPGMANGILFDAPSGVALAEAIRRAIHRLGTPVARAMQRRGMLAALGWEGPARVYESVYRCALKECALRHV